MFARLIFTILLYSCICFQNYAEVDIFPKTVDIERDDSFKLTCQVSAVYTDCAVLYLMRDQQEIYQVEMKGLRTYHDYRNLTWFDTY